MKGRRLYRICFAALVLLCLGVAVSMTMKESGADFKTYHYAGGLALRGELTRIYTDHLTSPWIYAPGLALGFAPLGALSRGTAFGLWTLAQIGVILALSLAWARRIAPFDARWAPLALLAPLLLARPLVFCLSFGTIDIFIFAAGFSALLSRVDLCPPRARTMGAWAVLTFLTMGKPLLFPLLFVPWIAGFGIERRVLAWERAGQVIGILAAVVPVWAVLGFDSGWRLHDEWIRSLVGRGMPIDTQNQSLSAFLFRWLTDERAGVLSLDAGTQHFGFGWFSSSAMGRITTLWTALTLLIGLIWQWRGRGGASPVAWAALLLAWAIVPSHIAWKSYFIFGLPAVGLALTLAARDWERGKRRLMILVGMCAAAVNFSTFDFIGVRGHAYAEALSVLLWAHFLVVAIVFAKRALPKNSAGAPSAP